MKIVWICHFSNKQIQNKLNLSKRNIISFIKGLIGKKSKIQYKEFAPWVSNLIKEFEHFEDVELHVISPHFGLHGNVREFDINGVQYHFFEPEGLSLTGKLRNKFFLTGKKTYKSNRKIVRELIRKIKPDIINLIGAENPYYSVTSLDIKDIPVYVSLQTVYTNPDRHKFSTVDQHRWDIELAIHKKEKYFGATGRMHRDLLLNNNPEAIVFKMFFPLQKPADVKEVPKVYDFVFFAAGVNNKKGVEDAIEALSIASQVQPAITLNIVGRCHPDYKTILQGKINDLNLQENIAFHDYFPVHADMHQHIKKSRFAILPNKLDIISGTVIEAILLEIPVVTYKTSGSPYLNKDGETVLLAEIGDVNKLAENMIRLLNEPMLADTLKREAKAFVEREFNNDVSAKRLLNNYKSVINHYRQRIDIPEEQLFSTEEFPIY